MCGISGIYNFKSLISINIKNIQAMNDIMQHRGPDDEGIFLDNEIGFGHRRLSVIDISNAAGQPLCNENKTIWLIFNGEIYNYLELIPELQSKGHLFKSKSDSEVIIHAYEEWGVDCVHKFNGMFSFAIWDKLKKRLFIARDRLGVKPLYYALNNDGIVFASEIKAILTHPGHANPSAINIAVYNYVNEGYLSGNKTLFNNIFKLLPGSYMIIENQELKEHSYWRLELSPTTSNKTEQEFAEELRELLIDAIKIRLRSDVPVGFHLSGGLDSSAIVSIADKFLNFRPETFSIRFNDSPEFDENQFIEIVKSNSNTYHKEIIPDFNSNFPDQLSKMIYLLDEPTDGPAVLSKYQLNKFIKENGITVALTGQGADEIFGGYKRFIPAYIKDLKNPEVLKQFFSITNFNQLFANGLDNSLFFMDNFSDINCKLFKYESEKFKNSLFSDSIIDLIKCKNENNDYYKEMYPQINSSDITNVSKKLHYETLFYLQSLLHSEDRTGMGVSLETRTPFVDYRIVELASQIPSVLKLKNLSTKYILREAMKGILPEPIRQRKDKKGFPTPAAIWFRTSQKEYLKSIIYSDEFKSRDIFKLKSVKNIFDEHQAGKDHTFKLWFILNTELWFRKFIDKPVAK